MRGFVPEQNAFWTMALATSFLAFFIFLGGLEIFHKNTTTYPTDLADLKALHKDQCEKPVNRGRIVEVENTLSNIGYAVAGAIILLCAWSWIAQALGATLVLLAIFSGLYHATLDPDPQVYDVVFVYAALLVLSAYISHVHIANPNFFNIGAIYWIVAAAFLPISYLVIIVLLQTAPGTTLVAYICLLLFVAAIYALAWATRASGDFAIFLFAALVMIATLAISYLARAKFGWDSTAVFPILIVLLSLQIVLLAAMAGPIRWGVVGWELALLIVVAVPGFVARLSDGYDDSAHPKWLCSPTAPIQAHAVWHLLSAGALLIGYDLVSRFQLAAGDSADRPVVLRQESAIAGQ